MLGISNPCLELISGEDTQYIAYIAYPIDGQDSFIDNIFRFVQAGSEVSALLGRLTSAVGYQPTLAP